MAETRWIDLLDPTAEALSNHVPESIHARAMEQLLAPSAHDDEPRAKLEGHGDYVFGVLLVAVEVPDEEKVCYQELNLVMTRETLLTIRKTPLGGRPLYDPSPAQLSCRDRDSIGMVVYHLVYDIAERFLDLVDALTEEIEELEEGPPSWRCSTTR